MTRVLPTFLISKTDGALMSYQSFLAYGSAAFFFPPFFPFEILLFLLYNKVTTLESKDTEKVKVSNRSWRREIPDSHLENERLELLSDGGLGVMEEEEGESILLQNPSFLSNKQLLTGPFWAYLQAHGKTNGPLSIDLAHSPCVHFRKNYIKYSKLIT